MHITTKHINTGLALMAAWLFLAACGKSAPFVDTDPSTGQPAVPLTKPGGECLLVKIAQKNGGTKADNSFEIKRDTSLEASNISSFDSLSNKTEYTIQFGKKNDTIKLSTGEYFIKDMTTGYMLSFSTRTDLSDPFSDQEIYKYQYNAAGYLVKKLRYVNGSASALFETNYTYDNNNLLTGCVLYAGSKKDKLLQTVIDYTMTAAKKPWVYLFPDFFEGYHYLQALNFGKRGNYPVKNITTTIYDISDGSVLDTWATAFSGYVYSEDGFILQTTAKGDLQQGLGLLFGTTRFDYQCK